MIAFPSSSLAVEPVGECDGYSLRAEDLVGVEGGVEGHHGEHVDHEAQHARDGDGAWQVTNWVLQIL